jgi:hypothetical protein
VCIVPKQLLGTRTLVDMWVVAGEDFKYTIVGKDLMLCDTLTLFLQGAEEVRYKEVLSWPCGLHGEL